MSKDFTKEFFQKAWGEDGYYENFSYGVGIDKVVEVCLKPFYNIYKFALEIGPGGGVFTRRMAGSFSHIFAVDVIKKPEYFKNLRGVDFYELPSNSYDLPGIPDNSFDFCFSYNVFCHLSNEAITEYIKNVHRVLEPGGNFVFMLARFSETVKHLPADHTYQLGDLTPVGHFYQDERTLDIVMGEGWEVVSRDMIPEHRDIIIHLRKV